MLGRALVTSIPKCGKNLIRSYFDALGLRRSKQAADLPGAISHVHAHWLATRLADAAGDGVQSCIAETAPAFQRTLASFETLPDGRFIHGHIAYDERLAEAARSAGLPIVFLYRDPRACLASLAHFLIERGEPSDLAPRLTSPDVTSALRLLLEDDGGASRFEQVYAPYEGWRHAEGILALRYEDLVGSRGGGSATRQIEALTALASHVGWQGGPWTLLDATTRAFNPRATTFRRGTIDGWQNDLRGRLHAEQRAALDDLSRSWGYPETPEAPSSAVQDTALADLLAAMAADRAELSARLDAAIHQNAEQHAQIAQLRRRVDELSARRVIRLANGLGRLMRAIGPSEQPQQGTSRLALSAGRFR